MISPTSEKGFAIYTISSPDRCLQAKFIPERGGIGSSIRIKLPEGEKELLYLHDFFWEKEWLDLPGGWPFLFPVCARLERDGKSGHYLYDGHLYELPIHGFSWNLPWTVVDVRSNQLTLCLTDNEQTRLIYPFSFKITLIYRAENGQLVCEQCYENKGNHPLPYYAGFHPYFLTPPANKGKSKVYLDYHPKRHFIYNKQLTDLVGESPVFKTPVSITHPEINEQLTMLGEDKRIQITYPKDFRVILEAKGVEDPNLFSYIQLYTIPEKPFFCVEPWMSFPNALNTVLGARWLKPGQSERGVFYLRILIQVE
jgi:galactose mutarotase-like enzyme